MLVPPLVNKSQCVNMIFLSTKSLNCKDSNDCNLGTIVEPLITREACVNGSGIEEVGSSELETDVLSSPLESKIIFDLTL